MKYCKLHGLDTKLEKIIDSMSYTVIQLIKLKRITQSSMHWTAPQITRHPRSIAHNGKRVMFWTFSPASVGAWEEIPCTHCWQRALGREVHGNLGNEVKWELTVLSNPNSDSHWLKVYKCIYTSLHSWTNGGWSYVGIIWSEFAMVSVCIEGEGAIPLGSSSHGKYSNTDTALKVSTSVFTISSCLATWVSCTHAVKYMTHPHIPMPTKWMPS